jgi:hypothetical protein
LSVELNEKKSDAAKLDAPSAEAVDGEDSESEENGEEGVTNDDDDNVVFVVVAAGEGSVVWVLGVRTWDKVAWLLPLGRVLEDSEVGAAVFAVVLGVVIEVASA